MSSEAKVGLCWWPLCHGGDAGPPGLSTPRGHSGPWKGLGGPRVLAEGVIEVKSIQRLTTGLISGD